MLYELISIYLFAMLVTMVYWASYVRSLNGSRYTRKILLLCIAICIYMFGYSMELNATTEFQIMFWNRFEYIGIPFVSALWLTVALIYTGHYYPVKKWVFAALYLIPFVTFALRFTNEYHHLYIASVRFSETYGRLLLVKQPGLWMYVQLVHSLSMIIITLILYIYSFNQNKKKDTGKICLMLAASFFAVAGLILVFLGPFDLRIDYMVLFLPLCSLTVIQAIRRFDFLETKSMARNKLFEVSSDAILFVNQQGKVIDFNKSASCFFERINIHITEGHLSTLFESNPALMESLSQIETSMISFVIDSQEKFYEISTKNIRSDHNMPCGGIKCIRDVTEIHKLNESLKRQAMVDELSGLINRRAFMQIGQEWVKESLETGSQVHLLMMDLDYFKEVNDQYGHQTGDAVIHSFGNILKSNFPKNCLTARLGGEEFAALLSDFDDEEIKQKAHQVLNTVALYEHVQQNRIFHVTVSIGISKKSLPAQTLDDMIHLADRALYQSKNRGRNCITMSDAMNGTKD